MKIFRRTVLTLALVLAFTIGTVWVMLKLPVAGPLRTSVVASLLGHAMNRDVRIEGGVEIAFANGITLHVAQLRLARLSTSRDDDWHCVEKAIVTIPLDRLLDGSFATSSVELSGATIYLAGEMPNDHTNTDATLIDDLALLPTLVLTDPLSQSVVLRDFRIVKPDQGNGWGSETRITHYSSNAVPSEGILTLSFDAVVNNIPIKVSGRFPNVLHLQPGSRSGPFTLEGTTAGVRYDLNGTIDLDTEIAVVTADLQLDVASLGELEDLLGLKRAAEGTARLDAAVSGPLDAPSARDISLKMVLEEVADVSVTGAIKDLETGTGMDLDFSVDMVLAENGNSAGKPLFDIELQRFHGSIIGDRERFFIRDFIVETDLAVGNLQNIGPVAVDRIVRDDNGRLGLLGIHASTGDPDKPAYAFEGRIGDTLQLADIEFSGQFNLPVSGFLNDAVVSGAPDLGYFSGTFSLNDTSGELAASQLQASVTGSDLLSLSLQNADIEKDGAKHPALKIDLAVPDFAAFSKQAGLDSSVSGRAGYQGLIYYTPVDIGLSGALDLNDTRLSGSLSVTDNAGAPAFSGAVTSELLHLKDLRNASDIAGLMALPRTDDLRLDKNVTDRTTAAISIKVDRIAEAGKSASGFNAQLNYSDDRFLLDPFSLVFVGGTVTSKLTIDTGSDTPRVDASGRIGKLKFGTFLRHLGIEPAVTGTLYASFDLAAAGRSFNQLLRTASGKTATSLWGGEISDRAIDLSGMSVVTWLFRQKRDAETARLVCAVLPLSIKNGQAHTSRMIVETDNVQLVGEGRIDLKDETVDLTFLPRAKRPELVQIVTTFKLHGSLNDPKVEVLEGGGAGRVVGEVLSAPLNLLAGIFSGGGEPSKQKPCTLPKTTGPK